MDYSSWIFGSGPSSAKLMLVGEAPGRAEDEAKLPFVGPSGEMVTEFLENVGIKRPSVYITNVVKVRPPQNDLTRLQELGYKVEDFIPLLYKEIEAVDPNCILSLGSLALKILTGYEGIKNYRGSILPCLNYPTKVVPTIHPAALFDRTRGKSSGQGMFSWKQKIHIQLDFAKAKRQSEFKELRLPQRNLRVVRDSLNLERFLYSYRDYNKAYLDTEVLKGLLVCLGIAFTPHEAISVPLIDLQSADNPRGIAMNEMLEIWRIIAEFLAGPVGKVGQNFKADKVYWLEPYGFRVENFLYDAMMKMHTLSPELPKSLAFQASILTDEPFWKSEGREYNPLKDNINKLLLYNAKDCAVNCECDIAMDEDMKEFGLEKFFQDFVVDLYPVYEHMEKRGLRINLEVKKKLSESYKELLVTKNKEAFDLIGFEKPINVNSSKKVAWLLYDYLRLPRRVDTTDITLISLKNKTKDQRKLKILTSIQDRRSISKIKSTYIDCQLDYDGRLRWSTNQVGTETGRTSSSIIKVPLRPNKFGMAIQTVPKHGEFGHDVREMIEADEGKILMEWDQSQAEARIVALLAGDLELLSAFDKRDVHKWTYSMLFDVSEDTIDDEMRQVGKMGRHAYGYDIQKETLALKTGISIYRAGIVLDKMNKISPLIKDGFHEGIQEALANNHKVLMTPFGRRREFFEKWGRELFKEAYAHIPQSTIGDNTKRAMKEVFRSLSWFEILIETHDAFTGQCDIDRVLEAYLAIKPLCEKVIDFSKCSLPRGEILIPWDCKIGFNWRDMTKFKG